MSLESPAGHGSAREWIKSSYSGADDPSCVEVAATQTVIRVRDSKNTDGPQLAFTRDTWAEFVRSASED
ncbi:DUF397 domain-containing protein [Streptomyces orinoci]|uniref:DUF397 domain-containing protein n=1 Tax=Streptomyces orinoci TaxID=67339 RepID=A0ABV3K2I1_STRON|nr:DUF397 domain-containing protein [Streptomyces orinoci]